jgi:mRNA interferase RelE/StbE
MTYRVELKPRAIKDLRRLPRQEASRVADALAGLGDGLAGDLERLANLSPEYRLRIGVYRALFEVQGDACVMVYRIVHRREAYRHR